MSNLDQIELSPPPSLSALAPNAVVRRRGDRPLKIVHLAASPFLGGPERQILGLARSMPCHIRTILWTFAESGRCLPFLEAAHRQGLEALALENNAPNYRASIEEIAARLSSTGADLLLCHGYKPDILGGLAAHRAGVPVVAVSRGWTGTTLKVRLNEALDRINMMRMDRVVCVSEGQAKKVSQAGIPSRKVVVIRNAICAEMFDRVDPLGHRDLLELFPEPPSRIVGAAGRLSPEKGFDILIRAASLTVRHAPGVGFVIFGEGPLHDSLVRRIDDEGLTGKVVLAPFTNELDRLIPHLDLLVLPSYTEGLPNVALEASAASVAIVATNVGGTPEVVEDGETGYLVPPGDPATMAARISELLSDRARRERMGRRGRKRIETHFTFEAQAQSYLRLFDEMCTARQDPSEV
jgi:glycosyltransferase involved in cell wall biosynthesis